MREALAKLAIPSLPPVIHVAGTNGKGSTIAFMRAIAEAADLQVHAFTKPQLMHLRERFIVAGQTVGDATLIAAAERVAAIAPDLTQFEAQVGAALLLFAETPAHLALLETRMGGRDDATNVIARPALSVITPIALDHQDVLGATLAEIAAHKAGILKRHAPAVLARQLPEAMAVIEAQAEQIGAPLWRQGGEWDAFAQAGRLIVQTDRRALDLPLPALAGPHQVDNAGLAVAAFLRLGSLDLSDDTFAAGVAAANWPGRLQPITHGVLYQHAAAYGAEVWVDGGHNPHAAAALARALREMSGKRPARTALIIGMRARKDWRGFIETLAPAADLIAAVPLMEDSAHPEAMAAHTRALGFPADVAHDVQNALARALANDAKRVLICGSLLLAGEVLSEWNFAGRT